MAKSFEPWIKIPRTILGLSLENELVVPVFVYLNVHKNIEGRVFGTAHLMAHYCDLAPDGRSGRAFDKCLSAIDILKREGYLKDYKEAGYACRKYEHRFELVEDKLDAEDNFARIDFAEIRKLLGHRNSTGRDKDCSTSYEKLLRALSYIRQYQCTVDDGDNELVYSLLKIEQIACDLGIAYRTALSAVTVLRNLCLIDYQPYRTMGWDKQWKTVASVFIPNYAADNRAVFDRIMAHLKSNNPYKYKYL